MLAKRLTQRGVALSSGALAAVLAHQVASAGVPNSVVVSTIKAASLFAAGTAAATGAISVKVAALTEGVMKAMLFTKLKAAIAVVLILGFVATGTTILTCRTAAGQDDKKPAAENPVEPAAKQKKEKDKEIVTAWGKEVGGLQAGLGYRSGENRAYGPGETVKLVVRVRNVGKEAVKFEYLKEFFIETPPAVTDGEGKPVPLGRRTAGGLVHVPVEVNLAPGKEIELAELKLEPRSGAQSAHPWQWNLWGTGKFSVQYERLAHPDIDKIVGKLATGKLELVISFTSEPPPAATGKEAPQKKDREDANLKPIKIRVYIEKVNVDASTITASCMLIGDFDNVTKPLRLENLQVSGKAKITDRGKEVKLRDLKLLPRDTHFYLFLKAYSELGFEVVGIETIRSDPPPAAIEKQ